MKHSNGARRAFLRQSMSVCVLALLSGSPAEGIPAGRGKASGNRASAIVSISIDDYPALAHAGGSVLLTLGELPFLERCGNGQSRIYLTRVRNDEFAAVTARCTHDGCCIGPYNPVSRSYTCPCHESEFDAYGAVLADPANEPLASYPVVFDGAKTLRIDIPGLRTDISARAPTRSKLGRCHPNPVRQIARIDFEIAEPGHLVLELFSVQGLLVATLHDSYLQPGRYVVSCRCGHLTPGPYFYRLRSSSGFSATKNMLIQA